jgi:hypothetical protein
MLNPFSNKKSDEHVESITLSLPVALVKSHADYANKIDVMFYIKFCNSSSTVTIVTNLCHISGKIEKKYEYSCPGFTQSNFQLLYELAKKVLENLRQSYLDISRVLNNSAISSDFKQSIGKDFANLFSESNNSYVALHFKVPLEQLRGQLLEQINRTKQDSKLPRAA